MVRDRNGRSHNPAGLPKGQAGAYATEDDGATDDVRPPTPSHADTAAMIRGIGGRADTGSLSGRDRTLILHCDADTAVRLMDAGKPAIDRLLAGNPNMGETDLDMLIGRQPDAESERRVRSAVCLRRVKSVRLEARCEEWTLPAYGLPAETRRACALNLLQTAEDGDRIMRLLKRWPGREAAGRATDNPHVSDLDLSMAASRCFTGTMDGIALKERLLHDPRCGIHTLRAIHASKPYDPYIQRAVYAHPLAVDDPVLGDWRGECSPSNHDAAIGMAMNPRLTGRDARDLHAMGDWDVDERLARNPRTPASIRLMLMGRHHPDA